jgi:SAM-dependent methyltransferase
MSKKVSDFSTDSEWEEWGRRDPYFGVITHPKFRLADMTEQSRREFFDSGVTHVDYVMRTIRQYVAPVPAPKRVLDFGCGVGRTLIPFAKIAQQVVGVDVSIAMLEESRKNCGAHQLTNVSLVPSDDNLSSVTGEFDLVHSFIVFQHVPLERGRMIFRNLLSRIASGGTAAVHVLYSKDKYADSYGIAPMEVAAESRRAPNASSPEMQMNPYNVNELLFSIQKESVLRLHTEFTDHGGELGVFFFFQKS